MEKQLNGYLSDLVVEYHKLQSCHWYVEGDDFFVVHEKLEEYRGEIGEMVDEVAEAMLMCGLRPITTLKDFADAATLKETKGDFLTSSAVYREIIEDYTYLIDCATKLKTQAEEAQEYLISIKLDTHITALAKALWMMGQHHCK